MLDNKLHLSITTPQGNIFDNYIAFVNLPGIEGEFEVYPQHASLLSLLDAGVITITTTDSKEEDIAIDWGYVKVEETKVSILIDNAVFISGNSDGEISKSLEAAKNLLESAKSQNSNIAALKAKVDRVARKH